MLIESLKKPEICYIYYGINASQTDVHQIENTFQKNMELFVI